MDLEMEVYVSLKFTYTFISLSNYLYIVLQSLEHFGYLRDFYEKSNFGLKINRHCLFTVSLGLLFSWMLQINKVFYLKVK